MKKLIFLILTLFLCCGVFAQQTLYRYYNPQIRKHYYTVNFNEYGNGANGWQLDGAACRVFDHEDRYRGIVPFFRYFNPKIGDHYYTTRFEELGQGANGYVFEHVECFVARRGGFRTVPFFEYFNPKSGDHFYTTNRDELGRGFDGYQFSRIAGYVFPQLAQ
jgi:hypothetical protein